MLRAMPCIMLVIARDTIRGDHSHRQDSEYLTLNSEFHYFMLPISYVYKNI